MLDLKAVYDDKSGKVGAERAVTIIGYYYNPDQKSIYFIAYGEDGEFINKPMSYFRVLKIHGKD